MPTQTLTFAYQLSNFQVGSASVTFQVSGPTAVAVAVNPQDLSNTINILPPSANNGLPTLGLQVAGAFGVQFQASATLPANQGTYIWVQLLDNLDSYLRSAGPNTGPFYDFTGKLELDSSYPYGFLPDRTRLGGVYTSNVNDDTSKDSPNINLLQRYGEVRRDFTATMYLMWNPTLPAANCNPNDIIPPLSCTSIPVPLGTLSWQWTGDAINTLQPQQNRFAAYVFWNECCGTGSKPALFVQSDSSPGNNYGFPTWQTTVPVP